ncbi:MAG: helix-turn-helix domain-containing protein [Methylocella sp.]
MSDQRSTRFAAAMALTVLITPLKDLSRLKRLGERPDALACGAVRDCMGINPATLSHHMKELEIARLVEVVREGKFASYVLRRDVLEAFFQRLRGDLA